MITGGGASVVYLDMIAAHAWLVNKFTNYGELSGGADL
jgi:succinyl-CoA synthetase beta subunit